MKILVALDESDCSELAFQSVIKRRWPDGTQFRAMSVVEPLVSQCVGWHGAYVPQVMIDAEIELRKFRTEYIDKKAKKLKETFGDGCVESEVIQGPVWRTIVEDAKEWGADLIVLGSHGRSGFSKLFLGSVANSVAEHADCSVEIIKGHPLTDGKVA